MGRVLFEWHKHMLELEEAAQVLDKMGRMQDLKELLLEKMIPRLLKPMETESRSITPNLVHGDFWHGKIPAPPLLIY